jgi:hypothetical protein
MQHWRGGLGQVWDDVVPGAGHLRFIKDILRVDVVWHRSFLSFLLSLYSIGKKLYIRTHTKTHRWEILSILPRLVEIDQRHLLAVPLL